MAVVGQIATADGGDAGDLAQFDIVEQALRRLASVNWGSKPMDVQTEAVARSAVLAGQVTAVDGAIVGGFEGAGEWRADGDRSVTVAVRKACNGSQGTARGRVVRSRKLAELPLVADALLDGEISADAARLILDADRAEVHDDLVRDQKTLLDAARQLEHVDFVKVVKYWEQLADPDRADRDAINADEKRSAHASWVGDRLRLDADMTRAGGGEFKAELERLEQHAYEADWAQARERLGDDATIEDLTRTPAQRRCDSLVEMARRSAALPGDRPAPKGRVVLNLHMDYPTFVAELARLMGLAFEYPTDRLCELDDGTPLVPSEALNLALGGEVRRIVFGADGHVLDYGKAKRLFTGALADAVRARDRRCQMPGCLLPASKCQIDHVDEHQHGGETNEANGECLCRFHNLWKTNHLTRYRRLRGWDP